MRVLLYNEQLMRAEIESGLYEDLIEQAAQWCEEGYILTRSKVPEHIPYEAARREVAIGCILQEAHNIWSADSSCYYDSYHKIMERIEDKRARGILYRVKGKNINTSYSSYSSSSDSGSSATVDLGAGQIFCRIICIVLMLAACAAVSFVLHRNAAQLVASSPIVADLVANFQESDSFRNATPSKILLIYSCVFAAFTLITTFIPVSTLDTSEFGGKLGIGIAIFSGLLLIGTCMIMFPLGWGWLIPPIFAWVCMAIYKAVGV